MNARGIAVAVVVGVALTACRGGGDDGAGTTQLPPTSVDDRSTVPTAPVDDDDQGIGPPRPGEIDGSSGLPRVCLMLPSYEEIEAIIGSMPASSQEGVLRGVTTCFVRDADETKLMTIAIGPSTQFDDAAAATGSTPVDGFDEGAVWVDGTLHVLKGAEDVAFALFPVPTVDDAALLTLTVPVATDAMTRYRLPDDSG